MSKDKYSVHWDGSEEMGESHHGAIASPKQGEPGLPDHVLDQHHETLMKAHSIKNNPHIMKHLGPHMEKKMNEMKNIVGGDGGFGGKRVVKSIDDIKKKSKEMD